MNMCRDTYKLCTYMHTHSYRNTQTHTHSYRNTDTHTYLYMPIFISIYTNSYKQVREYIFTNMLHNFIAAHIPPSPHQNYHARVADITIPFLVRGIKRITVMVWWWCWGRGCFPVPPPSHVPLLYISLHSWSQVAKACGGKGAGGPVKNS